MHSEAMQAARGHDEMLAVGLGDAKTHGLKNDAAEYQRLITLLESRIGT